MPGGYCASACDACDDGGICIETKTLRGSRCLVRCSQDADCRLDEGYLCSGGSCVLPNSTPISPRTCVVPGPAFDLAFSETAPVLPPAAIAIAKDRAVVVNGVDVAEPSDCAQDCRAATFAAGTTSYVAYSAAHGIRVRASSDRGKTWRPAVTASAGDFADLAIGSALHVVALQGDEHGLYGSAMHEILYTSSIDGARHFTAPVVVSRRDESIPFALANPAIALDDRRGWIYVTYARGDRSAIWDIVVAASKDKGATWSRSVIGDGCSMNLLPAIAVDGVTGNVHVAYYANAKYQHAVCLPGATRCTRKSAIGPATFSTTRYAPDSLGDRAGELAIEGRTLRATWRSAPDAWVTATAKL